MKRHPSLVTRARRRLRPYLAVLASVRDIVPALLPLLGFVVIVFFLDTMIPHVKHLVLKYEVSDQTATTFALSSETAVAIVSLMYQFQIGKRPLMFLSMCTFLAASAFFQHEYYVSKDMPALLAIVASCYLPLAVALVSYAIGSFVTGKRQPAKTAKTTDDKTAGNAKTAKPADRQSALTVTETTTRTVAASGKSAKVLTRHMDMRKMMAQGLAAPEIRRRIGEQYGVSDRTFSRDMAELAGGKERP